MSDNYKRDYFEEAHALLKQTGYKNYIERLLPGGKWKGAEYSVLNPTRNDKKIGSFSINTNGKWSDFAIGRSGKDLIDLTAYIKGVTNVEACHLIGVPRPDTNEQKYNSVTKTEPAKKKELPTVPDRTKTPEPFNIEVPEFTKENIGKWHLNEYKNGDISWYSYYNNYGTPVGCVVRWDFNINGVKEKKFALFSYDLVKQKWGSYWTTKSKPIYNLPKILANPNAPVMIVEGEKTAIEAKKLFPEYIVTTSCTGASAARSSDWSCLRGRDVTIAQDNDKAGAQYSKALNEILLKVEASSIRGLDARKLGRFTVVDKKLQQREGKTPSGYDLADNVADGWTAKLVTEHQEHKDFAPFFEVIKDVRAMRELPKSCEEVFNIKGKNYKLSKTANLLSTEEEDTDGRNDEATNKWKPLCGYLKPTHKIRDIDNSRGSLIQFLDTDGVEREVFLKRTDWLGEKGAVEILQDQGLQLIGLKQKSIDPINTYLNNFSPEFSAIGVETVGWQGEDKSVYMLPYVDNPRNIYQAKKEGEQTEYILQQKGSISRRLQKKGSISEWKRTIGEVIRGNHLHTLAVLAAIAPLVLRLLNEEGGFFHYVGATSIGKSTALHVAASVWGNEEIGTFRATDNNLEGVCKIANDGAIFLDELGEVEPEALSRVVYMVANGVTKGRSDRNGNARATTHFTVLAQSTGEIGIEAKLAEKKLSAKGGQLLRMGELDADRRKGLATFDLLKINPDTGEQFVDGKTQAEYLKKYAKINCGVVVDEFLKKFVKDIPAYMRGLMNFKLKWIKNKAAGKNRPEIDRMLKRFSTLYAVGVVASNMGILPHTAAELEESVNVMFNNWLERRGGDAPHELNVMINDLHVLCKQHHYLRFQMRSPAPDDRINPPNNKAGYYGKTGSGPNEYWIDTLVFKKEILQGRDEKVFLPLLTEAGYIEKKEKNTHTQKKRVKGQDPERFYIVPTSVFSEQSEDNDTAEREDTWPKEEENGVVVNGKFSSVNCNERPF